MRFDDTLIVIPCLDEAHNLPRLLDQLARQAPGAMLVVADGGSRDNSGEVARLVTAARCREVAAVVVAMRAVGSGCRGRAIAAAQNAWAGTGGAAHRHPGGGGRIVDHGHHALMRIDRFSDVGGYAEDLAHNEDFELDHRLRASGGTIWLQGDLAIAYHPRTTLRALFAQYRGYGRGKAIVARRHRLPLKLRQWLPAGTAPALVAAVAAPWLGWPLALPAAAWIVVSLAAGVAIGVRAKSCCAMLAGVAALTMHLGWSCGFWFWAERWRR